MRDETTDKQLVDERRWHFFYSVLVKLRATRPDILSEEYQSCLPSSWIYFTTGHNNLRFGSSFSGPEILLVTLYISEGPPAVTHPLFHALRAHRDKIERRIDAKLDWKQKKGVGTCCIEISRPGPDLTNKRAFAEASEWVASMLINFSDIFCPYIERL